MTDLPQTYMPKSLRPMNQTPRKVRYGVGVENDNCKFGMYFGPVENVEMALEQIPTYPDDDDRHCIIQFNADGSNDAIYKWSYYNRQWERITRTGISLMDYNAQRFGV